MEIVALHDTNSGEEVYMDYGKAWEDAWEKHVANFYKPPPLLMSAAGKTEEPFVTAKKVNKKEGPFWFQTIKEKFLKEQALLRKGPQLR